MTIAYSDALKNNTYIPNVVIYFKGLYWGIRNPDSGLTIPSDQQSVNTVTINPTKVDPTKVNTTINTYSFTLVDLNLSVTSLFNGVTKFFQSEPVEIYIGRCNIGMDFSNYLKLPTTYVVSVSRDGNSYNFSTTEAKDRLNRPAFNERNKLEVDILDATTEIDAILPIDPAKYPSSGLIKIEDEFISYSSIDTVNNRFSGCIRGNEHSIPVAHKAGSDIYLVNVVQGNPIDILLQCLISKGGGGAYDVLTDGAGLSSSLVDVTSFTDLQSEFFPDHTYRLLLYGIEDILNYLETQILFPSELRIVSGNSSKVSLTILNRRIFNVDHPQITDDSIKKQPTYNVDDQYIVNVVSVEYDYQDATDKYTGIVTLQDDASIADFGKRDPLKLQVKGVQAVNNGDVIAANIAQRFLTRFSYPKPEIGFNTFMDQSLTQLGDKAKIVTAHLPSVDTGDLNFGDTLEVIERGINWKTGDVKFKVVYTSFTGIKECFLAPSDSILSFTSQKSLTVGAGRGSLYRPGWKMRLYSNVSRSYVSSQVNEIESVVGDVVTFVNDWTDTLLIDYRIMFADFDDVTDQQRRYCYVSNNGLQFSNGDKTYQITL